MARRVVVTGMACSTSIGDSMFETWKALIGGKSGVKRLEKCPQFADSDALNFPKYGANIDPQKEYIKQHRSNGITNTSPIYFPLALAVAHAVLENSGIQTKELSEEEKDRFGISIGSALGSLGDVEATIKEAACSNYKNFNKMSLFKALRCSVSSLLSVKYQLKGYTITPAASCSSGLQSIGEGFHAIKNDLSDTMLVGGVENGVYPYCVNGFIALKASPMTGDAAEKTSKPFDKKRDGCVVGDGAGMLILEVK